MVWPFKPKAPPLHRALAREDDTDCEDDVGYDDGYVQIELLANRSRVRKKDAMKRNAVHVAVRNNKRLRKE